MDCVGLINLSLFFTLLDGCGVSISVPAVPQCLWDPHRALHYPYCIWQSQFQRGCPYRLEQMTGQLSRCKLSVRIPFKTQH